MGAPQSDEEAWSEVVRRWEDDEAHRRWLARASELGGMEGLAEAGRRYKAALDARPGDPVAARWRDEVLRRATALALAQLPRTAAPREGSPALRRATLVVLVLGLVAGIAIAALKLAALPLPGGGAP